VSEKVFQSGSDDNPTFNYWGAALVFAACYLAHRFRVLGAVLAFWLAYILTRPLGASLGDYLSQPTEVGGRNLGTGTTNLLFLAAILVLVAYLTATKIDQTPQALISQEQGSDEKVL
jgi:uncharacterized membrane-anchored protein